MLLSICVTTYKRIELLKKLLDSLVNQNTNELFKFEIIIVDNDYELSAKKIVDDFINCYPYIKIIYDIQPEKNISLARNLTIKRASGEYILFIDDDEFAANDWALLLYSTVKKYRADGAFGKVSSYFEERTPIWIQKCYLFNRPANQEGTFPAQLNTGNCIIRSDLLKNFSNPFNPEYGITGGSDSYLFSNLLNTGAKFISCPKALSFEYVPKERTKLIWLIKRSLRTGNNYSRICIENATDLRILIRLRELFWGSSQFAIALFLVLLSIQNSIKSFNWFLKSISNLGKILAVFNYYPKEYEK